MTSDRILGGVSLAVAGAMAWAAWDYVAKVEYEPVGPRAFPLLLAVLIAACGAWLLVRPSHRASFGNPAQIRRVGFCAACILAYAVLFQALGFIIATALMAIPVGRIFGGSWKQSLLTGVGMGVALFVLFDRLLDVVLPTGLLGPVFAAAGW